MDIDDYEIITKKPLRLTTDAGDAKTKKKKKKKAKIETRVDTGGSTNPPDPQVILPTITKAEEAFKAKQEKTAQQRIQIKASKTHKQRVEEFNKHLDSLSEHYDIPKVSWTK